MEFWSHIHGCQPNPRNDTLCTKLLYIVTIAIVRHCNRRSWTDEFVSRMIHKIRSNLISICPQLRIVGEYQYWSLFQISSFNLVLNLKNIFSLFDQGHVDHSASKSESTFSRSFMLSKFVYKFSCPFNTTLTWRKCFMNNWYLCWVNYLQN